jgi:hypothetical protein
MVSLIVLRPSMLGPGSENIDLFMVLFTGCTPRLELRDVCIHLDMSRTCAFGRRRHQFRMVPPENLMGITSTNQIHVLMHVWCSKCPILVGGR